MRWRHPRRRWTSDVPATGNHGPGRQIGRSNSEERPKSSPKFHRSGRALPVGYRGRLGYQKVGLRTDAALAFTAGLIIAVQGHQRPQQIQVRMARRKITEGEGIDPKDLPELTAKQQKFVEGILSGKTASDAYRAAYECENSSNKAIWVEASRLRSHPNVALWIDAAKASGFGNVSCTYEDHMRELERLRNLAETSGNIGAAVQAEQLRGKVAGHYVDKVQDVTAQTDAITTLKEIDKYSPELAASLAAQHGIEWAKPEGETAH